MCHRNRGDPSPLTAAPIGPSANSVAATVQTSRPPLFSSTGRPLLLVESPDVWGFRSRRSRGRPPVVLIGVFEPGDGREPGHGTCEPLRQAEAEPDVDTLREGVRAMPRD